MGVNLSDSDERAVSDVRLGGGTHRPLLQPDYAPGQRRVAVESRNPQPFHKGAALLLPGSASAVAQLQLTLSLLEVLLKRGAATFCLTRREKHSAREKMRRRVASRTPIHPTGRYSREANATNFTKRERGEARRPESYTRTSHANPNPIPYGYGASRLHPACFAQGKNLRRLLTECSKQRHQVGIYFIHLIAARLRLRRLGGWCISCSCLCRLRVSVLLRARAVPKD